MTEDKLGGKKINENEKLHDKRRRRRTRRCANTNASVEISRQHFVTHPLPLTLIHIHTYTYAIYNTASMRTYVNSPLHFFVSSTKVCTAGNFGAMGPGGVGVCAYMNVRILWVRTHTFICIQTYISVAVCPCISTDGTFFSTLFACVFTRLKWKFATV